MVPGSSKLVHESLQNQRKEKEARFPWVIKHHTNCLLQSHLLACAARNRKVMGIWCLWRDLLTRDPTLGAGLVPTSPAH